MLDDNLDSVEVRVLGALLEKELSTPDYYPMTLNALTAACNQKSNRDPVTDYDASTVQDALVQLKRKRLVGTSTGAGSRTVKYRHTLGETLRLDVPQSAALTPLLLRGPQTAGEVRSRSTRLYDFGSLEAATETLEALTTFDPPLVTLLPRQPGQKEARYAHLLAGEPEPEAPDALPAADSDDAVVRLEGEVADLRERLDALEAAFARFKAQFE